MISNQQMFRWGKEALRNGTIIGNIITGTHNGLTFVGYIDPSTGIIKNFHPVLN